LVILPNLAEIVRFAYYSLLYIVLSGQLSELDILYKLDTF
jgi:hypothetical protein